MTCDMYRDGVNVNLTTGKLKLLKELEEQIE